MTSRVRVAVIDVGLALGVATMVAALAVRADEPQSRAPDVAGYVLAAVVGAALVVRRRRPVAVLVGLATAVLVYNAYGFPGIGFLWPLIVALYTAAAAGRLAVALAVVAGMLTVDATWLLFAVHHPPLQVTTMIVTDATVAGLAVALGDAVRSRRGWAAETRERLRRMGEDKEREAQRALVDERLRIARELHDVTAHTLTVAAVQVNVAADALISAPAEAHAALDIARQVNDQALRELTAAVRVLRAGDVPTGWAPLPGLAQLDRLVAGVRTGGLEVELVAGGDATHVPAAVGLTVYRVVQEALTNVVKHAAATHVRIALRYAPDGVTVCVADDGRGPVPGGEPGHGLIGLRERVAGLDGRFTAAAAQRGFRVQAWIPNGTSST
ncbi:sensor histidine kinase [Dactylosporangium sucinum]|uniref:histidine kinase n=1 Tax=Dactylosporangium sucinum TaxID=1424081 RepID=A0A917X4S0_9ACTN|nr:histidine kinase [Dactylosporangium sucinum]GGM74276.1 two-component sensor histidine kinase [Dactylosporangium sucinum]